MYFCLSTARTDEDYSKSYASSQLTKFTIAILLYFRFGLTYISVAAPFLCSYRHFFFFFFAADYMLQPYLELCYTEAIYTFGKVSIDTCMVDNLA